MTSRSSARGFGGSVTALRAADTGAAVYEVQEVDDGGQIRV